jgi:nucleotide-binding universal stress UspA family protein
LYKNILIPTDGSDLATKAVVTEPFQLLPAAPIQLEYTPLEYKKHAEADAEKVLGIVSAAAKLAGVGCDTLHVEHEHVYQAIIDAAGSRRCDLVLMTSHGRRGVSAVVLGSETVKVLTHSKIPVLVYR